MADILPGAEPDSWKGDGTGVLVLHGFTGNPQSMRPLAEALAAAGCTVEMPLLPGHGTSVEDMIETDWSDWSGAAEAAYTELAGRVDRVIVAGLSMGGTLSVWLATRHPEIAGVIVINPAVIPQPELAEIIQPLLEAGETVIDGVGNDVAKEGVVELAYDKTPLAPLASLGDAIDGMQAGLADIRCPVLLMNAPEDHVVPPASSDHLAAEVSGPVTRVSLDRSYHVATIDNDAELIAERAVEFVRSP